MLCSVRVCVCMWWGCVYVCVRGVYVCVCVVCVLVCVFVTVRLSWNLSAAATHGDMCGPDSARLHTSLDIIYTQPAEQRGWGAGFLLSPLSTHTLFSAHNTGTPVH